MNSSRSFHEDDEDDTHLFAKAEQYVLNNCPNPDRIGCPGPAVLRAFVEKPENVALADLNDVHIMQCAECTRDLIKLRRAKALQDRPQRERGPRFWNWKLSGIAAIICFVAFSVFALYRQTSKEQTARLEKSSDPVAATVDLSGDGVSRGAQTPFEPPISLESRLLHLHLLLPHYSPSGTYRIFISRQSTLESAISAAIGAASVDGPRTEVIVEMDLRQVKPGAYFLGTQRLREDPPYYYSITIN